jgi:Mn2+/Fe2+ NRAMP family transporter
VVGAEFDWERGLSANVRNAPRFYAVLAVAIALAAVIAFTGVRPIRLLFIAGIFGGVGTPIGLAYLLLVGRNRRLMGDARISGWLLAVGWAVMAFVSAASLLALGKQLLA